MLRLPARARSRELLGFLVLASVLSACGDAAPAPAPAWPEPPASISPDAKLRAYQSQWNDLAQQPSAADGGGKVWLVSPRAEDGQRLELPVGVRGRFQLVYEAGPLGIAPGGSVWLEVSAYWGWDAPQTTDVEAPGYTRFSTTAPGVRLEAGELRYKRLPIVVRDARLAPGERIEIVYGAGSAGARTERYAERGERIRFGVDGDGDGVRAAVEPSPSLDFRAGKPAQLVVLVPASGRPNEDLRLTVALLDRWGNAGFPFDGVIDLEPTPGLEHPPSVALAAVDAGRKSVSFRAGQPGVYRVRARLAGGQAESDALEAAPGEAGDTLEAISNPLRVAALGERLFWADLHGHSRYSDGTGTPADYFAFARDVAALDAVALTDHDHWGMEHLDRTPDLWRDIRSAVADFHDPGQFVALLGYEWTHWLQGHRHVLYFGDEGSVLSAVDARYDTPPELWNALRGQAALTFAHHSAGGSIATNWEFPPDPELEPLTEIVSGQGSSEAPDSPAPVEGFIEGNGVRDALERGYRLGFVGSGDGHRGHPGLVHRSYPRGGLAGIYARALTRENLLAALRARRVYATNGPRIQLFVALDGAPMGAVVPVAASATQELEIRVSAEAPIERIDLIRSGGTIERIDLIRSGGTIEALAGGRGLDEEWQREIPRLEAGDYLYLRVVQLDGGAAWSSPIFALPDDPRAE